MRFRLRIPLQFTWEDRDGHHQAEGLVDNISAGGVYVLCSVEKCPVIGCFVSIDIALPMLARNGSLLRIKGTGRVVRHETREGGMHAFVAETQLSIFPQN